MPIRFACPVVLSLILILPATAPAQTSSGSLTCKAAFDAKLRLQLGAKGPQATDGSSGYVFDTAECQCHTDDIQLELQITNSIPASMPPGRLEVWIGTDCDQLANRTTTGACQEIKDSGLTWETFVAGNTSPKNVMPLNLPSDLLFATNGKASCHANQDLRNSVYILMSANGDLTSMTTLQQCDLSLEENTGSAFAPSRVDIVSDNSQVSLNWMEPQGIGQQVPVEYQVLCADNSGHPIPGLLPEVQAYSACVGGVMHRRNKLPSASSSTTPPDGGTNASDLGAAADNNGAAGVERFGINTNPSADEAQDGSATDGADYVTITNSDFAKSLDPAFLCSGEITANNGGLQAKIGGLQNHHQYQFVVVAIDKWGNPTAAPLVLGSPQPGQDLFQRFRSEGGRASGFCFIATAAFGSYEDRYVHVLRDFRDRVLLPTAWGRRFVQWYYAHSPPLARYIATRGWARWLTRTLLWPIIAVAAGWLHFGPSPTLLLGALLLVWLLRSRGWTRAADPTGVSARRTVA
jgi:hypothetical protein